LEILTKKKTNNRMLSLLLMVASALLIIWMTEPLHSEEPAPLTLEEPAPRADTVLLVRVLVTGDAMAHLPQTQAAYLQEEGIYSYNEVLQYITHILSDYDLRIVNLETTLGGIPYRGYPMFSAPDEYARDLHQAGFNLFCLANNHAVDRFNKGLIRTLNVLDSLEIRHTGTFRDTVHRDTTYPLILDINGIRIALLNATYGTNGLYAQPPAMVNMIDTVALLRDLDRAREAKPDLIMAVMHWGGEYLLRPDAYQRRTAGFLARQKVDVVIGHHPHVIQPIEWITTQTDSAEHHTLVFWSLGNFFSNQRQRYRDGGVLAGFDLIKNTVSGTTRIGNLQYEPVWVWRGDDPLIYRIIPGHLADTLMNTYNLSPAHRSAGLRFFEDTRKQLTGIDLMHPLPETTNP
jgi:hypothetical protein